MGTRQRGTLLYRPRHRRILSSSQVLSSSLLPGDAAAIEASDLLIVIGGDGTMLYAARLARGLEKPILGINSGRLGFMNDVSIEEMYSALDSLIKKITH